jgi:hypothetical protein
MLGLYSEVEEFVMTLVRVSMAIGLLFVVGAVAAEPTPQPTPAPKMHHTACSLAESMASKLASKSISAESAQRTCQQLAPTMSEIDHAEFMRCCMARLRR